MSVLWIGFHKGKEYRLCINAEGQLVMQLNQNMNLAHGGTKMMWTTIWKTCC